MNPIKVFVRQKMRALKMLASKYALGNQQGVAAVEFALILPFLLLLYFGSVEITQGILINRQVSLTATTVSNIVTQYTTISASKDLPDILHASAQIMEPYSTANTKMIVS